MDTWTVQVIALTIAITVDRSDVVTAKRQVVNPGERWLYIGQNLVVQCNLTGKSYNNLCNVTSLKGIFKFELQDNSSTNRRYIRNQMKVVSSCSNQLVTANLSNATESATGIYWCGSKRSSQKIDVHVIDRLRAPENISCVFHGRKTLNCTYSVYDSIGHSQYKCFIGERYIGKPNEIEDGECQMNTSALIHITNENGFCSYKCAKRQDCRENIHLFITGRNPKENKTFCHLAQLRKLLKPGKIGGLQVTDTSPYSISVHWNKPNDRDNDDVVYLYHVVYKEENGEARNITVTNQHKKNITKLKAGRQYTITVAAKPSGEGFIGETSSVQATTKETLPETGPEVPAGSYSFQNKTSLAVYWQELPEYQRGGIITKYEVRSGNSIVTRNARHHWAEIKLPSMSSGNLITVSLRSATSVGYSRRNTTVVIKRNVKDKQSVVSVYRVNETVTVWRRASREAHTIRVHRCYGRQSVSQQQLVDCKTQIEYRDVNDTTTDHQQWSNPSPPSMSCEKCQWHYAVSVHLNNDTAGMVWNTDRPSADSDDHVTGDLDYKTIYAAIIPLATGLLLLMLVLLCMAMKRSNCCADYIIILPSEGKHLSEELEEDVRDTPRERGPELAPHESGNIIFDRDIYSYPETHCNESCQIEKSVHFLQTTELHLSSVTAFEVEDQMDVNHDTAEEESQCYDCIGDDSNEHGSAVSDYRLQILASTGYYMHNNVNETHTYWDENDQPLLFKTDPPGGLPNSNHEDLVRLPTKPEDPFKLSSSSSSSASTSNPMITSYSEMYVPLSEVEALSERCVLPAKHLHKTNSSPLLTGILGKKPFCKEISDSLPVLDTDNSSVTFVSKSAKSQDIVILSS